MERCETIIVGAGIAGLYLASRLRERGRTFKLFEREDACGGRIRTIPLPTNSGPSDHIPAELGAMRFTDRHVIFGRLIEHLGFQKVEVKYPAAYYLRGRFLGDSDFRTNALHSESFPYDMPPTERGRTPHELVAYVIWKAASDSSYMTPLDAPKPSDEKKEREDFDRVKLKLIRILENTWTQRWFSREEELLPVEWDIFRNYAHLPARDSNKVHLRHIGFANLLKHYLSEEGWFLVNNGYGFASVIANWNAGEAMRWCLEDYGPSQKFFTIKGPDRSKGTPDPARIGISGVARALKDLVKSDQFSPAHSLLEVKVTPQGFELLFHHKDKEVRWMCSDLVLALPTRALEKIHFSNFTIEGGGKWRGLLRCSHQHRMVKIILAYKEPWWKHTGIPRGDSGCIFTDVPERQIYYFGPDWLQSVGFQSNGCGFVMVYNDSRYTDFWRPFTELDYWSPDSLLSDSKKRDAWYGRETWPDSLGSVPDTIKRRLARQRLVDKVSHQLQSIHRYNVPEPLYAIWNDWSEDGAWHTWMPHVNIRKTVGKMIRPLAKRDFLGMPTDEGEIPLYVCGEAYSDEQGWMEGALKSAEAVARRLDCPRPDWLIDDEFKIAGYQDYKTYMRHYNLPADP